MGILKIKRVLKMRYLPIVDYPDDEKRGVLLPRCYMCNQVPENGIRGGIRIKRAFICNKCEEKLMLAEVGAPEYRELLEKIKQVLR